MAVSREYITPQTGRRCATRAERSRDIRHRAEQEAADRHNAYVRSTNYDDPRRLDKAAEAMRSVRQGVAVPYVAMGADPYLPATVSGSAPGNGRAFVGVMDGDRADSRAEEPTVMTDALKLVQQYREKHGGSTEDAIRVLAPMYPDVYTLNAPC